MGDACTDSVAAKHSVGSGGEPRLGKLRASTPIRMRRCMEKPGARLTFIYVQMRCPTQLSSTATPAGPLAPLMKLWLTSVPSMLARPIVPSLLVQ
jgi:hypothetical protein